ncbi:MAG: hypothetical protein ABL919_11535 [Methylococcales bacterium]
MLLQKFFRKKSQASGIVAISYLQNGLAVAVANINDDNKIRILNSQFFQTLNPVESGLLLRDFVDKHDLAQFDCYLVLTSDNYRRVNIEAPAVAISEMSDAIRWKISDLVDFSVEKAAIDFFEVPASKRASSNMLEVVASPLEVITEFANKIDRTGLNLKVIDIQETVLRNLAVLLPENQRGVAVLYLQESSGVILIQKDGTIYLSRNIDIGYKQLGLDLISDNTDSRANIEQNNLALEIQRSLDYVESFYGIPPISGVAVIPLSAYTQELLNILNSSHGITARVMDLSAIVDCDILLDDATQSKCAPVIGATLRFAGE